MKLALALISALILMDYAAAAPWKQPSSYVPNKASLELGYEQVQEMEDYLEAGQKQNIQNNPHNDHRLQQQSKQHYPTAVMGGKKRQSPAHELKMNPSLTTGAVEAVFKSPTGEANSLRLFNAENDVILYIGLSFSAQKMTLNSKPSDGDWGDWVTVPGFPFPCCGYVNIFTLHVDITDKYFFIAVNGLEFAMFQFRSELRPPVERVKFDVIASDAELISLKAIY